MDRKRISLLKEEKKKNNHLSKDTIEAILKCGDFSHIKKLYHTHELNEDQKHLCRIHFLRHGVFDDFKHVYDEHKKNPTNFGSALNILDKLPEITHEHVKHIYENGSLIHKLIAYAKGNAKIRKRFEEEPELRGTIHHMRAIVLHHNEISHSEDDDRNGSNLERGEKNPTKKFQKFFGHTISDKEKKGFHLDSYDTTNTKKFSELWHPESDKFQEFLKEIKNEYYLHTKSYIQNEILS